MDSGFEALPPRTTGRAASKRRRQEDESGSSGRPGRRGGAAAAAATAVAAAAPSEQLSGEAAAARWPYDPPAPGAPLPFEYLDHTADVQLHSWGASLGDAFVGSAMAMFGYMTEVEGLAVDPGCTRVIEARGHDLPSLLYNFLDACLYAFASDDFVARYMRLLSIAAPGTGTESTPVQGAAEVGDAGAEAGDVFRIQVVAYGERFEFGRHPQGTEVKAITYSNMQIITPAGSFSAGADGTAGTGRIDGVAGGTAATSAEGSSAAAAEPAAGNTSGGGGDAAPGAGSIEHGDSVMLGGRLRLADPGRPSGKPVGPYDVYVIVDI